MNALFGVHMGLEYRTSVFYFNFYVCGHLLLVYRVQIIPCLHQVPNFVLVEIHVEDQDQICIQISLRSDLFSLQLGRIGLPVLDASLADISYSNTISER